MGTTWDITLVILLRQAHPHIHGDYFVTFKLLKVEVGLSPHRRGLLEESIWLSREPGLILIHTGTTALTLDLDK